MYVHCTRYAATNPLQHRSSSSQEGNQCGYDNLCQAATVFNLSSKFHSTLASAIPHVSQLQLLVLLTLSMEVYAAHTAHPLIKANIVEALERRAADALDSVVRHQKVLLPSHEQMLSLLIILQCEVRTFRRASRQRSPRWKARPVLQVYFLGAAPAWMCGFE